MRILIALLAAAIAGHAAAGETLIPVAQAALEHRLTDPGSVQYRDVRETPGVGVCGYYNSKNGFGGYTGFEAFAWRQSDGQVLLLDDSDESEERIIGNVRLSMLLVDAGCPEALPEWRETWAIRSANLRLRWRGEPEIPEK